MTFGMPLKKFQLLARPFEHWKFEDAKSPNVWLSNHAQRAATVEEMKRENDNIHALSSLEAESIQEM